MASKAYLPRKCVSRKEESHHRSEVQKRTPCSLTSNKSRTFQSLRSVTNVKKCSTANADSNVNKRQNSCNPQPSSDSTEETDFAGFTNLEDEAFQLASYIESDATFDEIMSEAREKNHPNSTLKDAFDLRDASLDELLDATIEELQNAVDGRNANTSISVTFRDSISNQMKMSPNSQTTVIDGTSERRNENIDAGKVGGSRTRSFHNVHSRKSNSSIGYPRILSNERANFGDQTRSRPTPNSSATHQTVLTRRATVSSSASTPSHSKAAFGRMPYTTWTKNVALKQKLIHLFNRPCHNYLTGKCSGGMCKWNHSLPPARDIYQKLMLLNDETVKYMYFNFVLRTSKAFVTYFPTMCEVLGKRKMKPILMEAVGKCEERDNVSFFKFIFDGLLLLGSSKMEALTTVIDRCSKNSKCYCVLLEIMIETDALYFVDTLKQCYLHGTICGELMQKLLQQVIEAPGTELLPVFIDILDNYSMCQTFNKEAFGRIIPRTMNLVRGNLSLTEKLSRIVNRMK